MYTSDNTYVPTYLACYVVPISFLTTGRLQTIKKNKKKNESEVNGFFFFCDGLVFLLVTMYLYIICKQSIK